jgi:hypothetical protein
LTAAIARPSRIKLAYVAGVAAALVTLIVSRGHATPYNNFVLLAQALLSGHAWIVWPGPYIDALPYSDGHYYVVEAPLPAVLLMPFVAIFGTANQTWLSIALAGVAVGAAWELGERFGLPIAINAWICAFLLAGTDLLWCAMLGDVWFIAHVSSVCFTMLALVELAGKRRGWVVGIWAACAFESRFAMIAALPVYLYLLLGDRERPFALDPRWRSRLLSLAAVLVPVAGLWLLYNYARWGVWNDIGYTAWYHQDQAGEPTGSPFQFKYLPNQLYSFFVQAPTQLQAYPGLRPEMTGVALTWTSPALILAFFARHPARWTIALWAAAALTAAPSFIYYVNGYAQFGMRHALDFEPFLVALMMIAVRDRIPQWGYVLLVYSMLAGFWGCWYWNTFVRV